MVKKRDDFDLEKTRHKNKMEEIKFEFDCKKKIEHEKHENQLTLQRIKNASIERNLARKRGY